MMKTHAIEEFCLSGFLIILHSSDYNNICFHHWCESVDCINSAWILSHATYLLGFNELLLTVVFSHNNEMLLPSAQSSLVKVAVLGWVRRFLKRFACHWVAQLIVVLQVNFYY